MRSWTFFILAWALVMAAAAPARAVVIFPKEGRAAIKAFLVRQDDEKVVIRQTRPDGSTVEREIYRVEIDDMIVSVSDERLASLRPKSPSAYRDYAEELAEKREDPDARQAAIRLYLMAAWLDRARLGRSCLLSMTSLARTPEEERTFRAMAYLLDPQHDRRLLKTPDAAAGTVVGSSARLPEPLMTALRLLRQGSRRALSKAESGSVRPLFDQIKEYLSYEEFVAAAETCRSSGRLPPEVLRKLIQLELTFGGIPQPASVAQPAADKSGANWSQTVRLGRVDPVPSLSLETLTEFDPRKCVFRDGQWVEPEP